MSIIICASVEAKKLFIYTKFYKDARNIEITKDMYASNKLGNK